MKKDYILIILCLAVALIGLGVWGLTRSSASAKDDPAGVTPVASQVHHASSADQYMDVTLPAGMPSVIKDYTGFRVSFNADNRTPNWVAWELLGSEVSGNMARSNKFWTDEELEGCPYTSDYTRSGYDRGHLCPAADQKWSMEAMEDCFVMANICPQDHKLNTGAWNTLENKERLWAQRDSAIMIVAGPIYTSSDTDRIGQNEVRVPSAFFKVFAAPYLDNPRGIAFIYPNSYAPGNMEQYAMTIDEAEQITGYNFFPSLSPELESEIESKASFREWNRR